MKKIVFVLVFVLLLNLSLANAITEREIKEAKNLTDSKTDCKNLSDSQLEIIGEYYMEQMHSGEAHELMHKIMSFQEGSETEKQFHINMAKTIYCGEGGAMEMMSMMMGNNMMDSESPQTNMMQGMMGGQNNQGNMMGNWGYSGYWNFFVNILYAILLIGLIILVYFWILKSWKSQKWRGKK